LEDDDGTPVRDQFDNDSEALTQWVFRKPCNHDPMRHRSPMNRKGRHKEEPIYAARSKTTVLYPLQNGKVRLHVYATRRRSLTLWRR